MKNNLQSQESETQETTLKQRVEAVVRLTPNTAGKKMNRKVALPYYPIFKEAYPDFRWAAWGTFTPAKPVGNKALINMVREIVQEVGMECNKSFESRLHYFIRLGGENLLRFKSKNAKKLTKQCRIPKPECDKIRIHAHIMISEFRLSDGKLKSVTKEQLADLLERKWKAKYGIADVRPYDPAKGGLRYILQAESLQSKEYEDKVALSAALSTYLKNYKKACEENPDVEKLDSFGKYLYLGLRNSGSKVKIGRETDRFLTENVKISGAS